ncbi:MAG: dockerin type I domain-containing protein [Rubripirellula sp.]
MRSSASKRRLRTSRRPRVERLTDRALLAVLGVAPGPDDNGAALFAEAIATANSTPEADTIELAAGTYDLTSLVNPKFDITSEIDIVGVSPSQTRIIGAAEGTTFEVDESGSLGLSRLTVFAPASVIGGAVWAKGEASLNQVAVIGVVDGSVVGSTETQITSLVRGSKIDIADSAIVDSAGNALSLGWDDGEGTTIANTIIAGSAAYAVGGRGVQSSLSITDSVVFDNGAGVSFFARDFDATVSGTTITRNQNTMGLAFRGEITESAKTKPGLRLVGTDSTIAVDFAGENVIVGNSTDSSIPEIVIGAFYGNAVPDNDLPAVLGTVEQADAKVAAVSVTTETVGGQRVLRSDRTLQGVNVDLSVVGDQTIVDATGRGSSAVFWDAAENRFFVESNPRTIGDLVQFSDSLATIDGGRVVGGGSESRFYAHGFSYGTENDNLTAAEKNTWNFFMPSEVVSQAGARIHMRPRPDGVLDFDYTPPADFAGTDTITVRGVTALGQESTGTITVDVVQKTGITVNVAASELDDVIDVAISTSGFGNVTSFNFDVGFDPQIVQLVDTDFGREFQFLTETRERQSWVNVSALGGFSRGSDLATLKFKRIADGSAGIELLGSRDVTLLGQRFTESSFSAYVNGQRVELSGFDQAYYYLSQDDVNRDGAVTARDSLNVVNRLGVTAVEGEDGVSRTKYERDYDANGDGQISASDALRIINRLGRQNVAEGETSAAHAVFSAPATTFLDPAKPIPSFVGRPGLPIDDGAPLDPVNITPPTDDQRASAELVAVDTNGSRVQRVLEGTNDDGLFVINSTGNKIGFGLDTVVSGAQTIEPETELTLVFFREDGSVISAYPNANTGRLIGDAIDTVEGQRIFVRVGTTRAAAIEYRLEFLELASQLDERPEVNPQLDALAVVNRQLAGESLVGVEGYEWMQGFGPDSKLGDDIHADQSANATLVRPFEKQVDLVTHIDRPGDVDWFRVPTQSDQVLVGVTGHDGTVVQFDVFDVDGNTIPSSITITRNGVIESASFPVAQPSEIFVRVTGESTGQYSFGIVDDGSQETPPTRTEPLGLSDEIGDTIADATDIAVRESGQISFTQTFETGDDVEVFRIPNALPGTLIVDGPDGITAEVLDQDGNVIQPVDPIFGGSGRFVIAAYGQKGFGSAVDPFVYLRVASSKGFVGRYNVLFGMRGDVPQLPVDFDPFDTSAADDRPDSALGDDPHADTIGRASSFGSNSGDTKTSFLDRAGDVDMFKVGGYGSEVTFSVHSEDIDAIRLRALGHDGVELPYLISRSDTGHFGIAVDSSDAPEYLDAQGNTRQAFYIEVSADDDSFGQYSIIKGMKQYSGDGYPADDAIIGFDDAPGELTMAVPIDVLPIEHFQSSFLDSPTDQDAYRFTADYASLSLTLNRNGDLSEAGTGAFDVFNSAGELVEPLTEFEDPFELFTSDFIRKTYDLSVGDSYTVRAYNEKQDAFGFYSLHFENQGNALESLDFSDAVDLTFGAGREVTVSVHGQIDDLEDVALYRFSTHAVTAYPRFTSSNGFRMGLFDAETGQRITENASQSHQYKVLDSASDNVTRDYVLAIWNRREAGEFDFDLTLKQLDVEAVDTVGDTFADAVFVEFEEHQSSGGSPLRDPIITRYANFEVHLNSADDRDMYVFTAEQAISHVATFPSGHYRDFQHEQLIKFELFDADGNRVDGAPVELGDLQGLVSMKSLRFETVPGQNYYVRFSQTSPNPFAVRAMVQ